MKITGEGAKKLNPRSPQPTVNPNPVPVAVMTLHDFIACPEGFLLVNGESVCVTVCECVTQVFL